MREQDFPIFLAGAISAAWVDGATEFPCDGKECILPCPPECPVKGMSFAEMVAWAKEIAVTLYGEKGADEIFAMRDK